MLHEDNRYYHLHHYAVKVADRNARKYGQRYRVQRVTWPVPLTGHNSGQERWYVAPTPAPAPIPQVGEPECNGICVMGSELIQWASGVAYPHPNCDLHGHLVTKVAEPCS